MENTLPLSVQSAVILSLISLCSPKRVYEHKFLYFPFSYFYVKYSANYNLYVHSLYRYKWEYQYRRKEIFEVLNLYKRKSKPNYVFLSHTSIKGSGSVDPLIVEVELNLRRGWVFSFTSQPLCNRGKRSQNSWVGQRMGPTNGLGVLRKRRISCQLPGIKWRFLRHQDRSLVSTPTSLSRLTLWAVTC